MFIRCTSCCLFNYYPFIYSRQTRGVSNDVTEFRKVLQSVKRIAFLTGAGLSIESGIPNLQGNTHWRKLTLSILDREETFKDDPGLVWEFYHYRRGLALKAYPNAGHKAIVQFENQHPEKKIYVVTLNLDGLHTKAGSKNIVEFHGSLFQTRCVKCSDIQTNFKHPIVKALEGLGATNSNKLYSDIPIKDLPHCLKCGGLLRPHVVWVSEAVPEDIVSKADAILRRCQALLVVGSSSSVYPTAAFATVMKAAGTVVAEFNIQPSPSTPRFDYYFEGPASVTLPNVLIGKQFI